MGIVNTLGSMLGPHFYGNPSDRNRGNDMLLFA